MVAKVERSEEYKIIFSKDVLFFTNLQMNKFSELFLRYGA